jgi:hypothetical protein
MLSLGIFRFSDKWFAAGATRQHETKCARGDLSLAFR